MPLGQGSSLNKMTQLKIAFILPPPDKLIWAAALAQHILAIFDVFGAELTKITLIRAGGTKRVGTNERRARIWRHIANTVGVNRRRHAAFGVILANRRAAKSDEIGFLHTVKFTAQYSITNSTKYTFKSPYRIPPGEQYNND